MTTRLLDGFSQEGRAGDVPEDASMLPLLQSRRRWDSRHHRITTLFSGHVYDMQASYAFCVRRHYKRISVLKLASPMEWLRSMKRAASRTQTPIPGNLNMLLTMPHGEVNQFVGHILHYNLLVYTTANYSHLLYTTTTEANSHNHEQHFRIGKRSDCVSCHTRAQIGKHMQTTFVTYPWPQNTSPW